LRPAPASLSAWCEPEEGKEGQRRSARLSARRGAVRTREEEGGKKERKEKKEKRRERKTKKEIGKREKKNRKNGKGKEKRL
jgi:hypothetical protein